MAGCEVRERYVVVLDVPRSACARSTRRKAHVVFGQRASDSPLVIGRERDDLYQVFKELRDALLARRVTRPGRGGRVESIVDRGELLHAPFLKAEGEVAVIEDLRRVDLRDCPSNGDAHREHENACQKSESENTSHVLPSISRPRCDINHPYAQVSGAGFAGRRPDTDGVACFRGYVEREKPQLRPAVTNGTPSGPKENAPSGGFLVRQPD